MLRVQYRASYACDCEGSREGKGREMPELTDGFLEAVENFTGTRGRACPWRAFDGPLTKRVLAAYEWYREGQLLAGVPRPSRRLVSGLSFYHRALQSSMARVREIERENRERQRA